jgi:hypothetical protein
LRRSGFYLESRLLAVSRAGLPAAPAPKIIKDRAATLREIFDLERTFFVKFP